MFKEAAIAQTLEDEFLELEPSQVLAALQQAGGGLEAARTLCARLAAEQRRQAAADRSSPSQLSTSPLLAHPQGQTSQNLQHQVQQADQYHNQRYQRQWWPPSEFCAADGATSASAVANGATSASAVASASCSFTISQRPPLVPHHVLPQPSQAASSAKSISARQQQQQQQPGSSMQPAARSGSAASSGSRQSPAAVVLRRLLGGAPAATADAGPNSTRQPDSILARGSTASSSSSSIPGVGRSVAAHATPAPAAAPTPASGFPPVVAQQERLPGATSATAGSPPSRQPEPPLHPHYAAVFLKDRSRQQLLQHVPPLHEAISADHMTLAYKPTAAACAGLPLGREAALFVVGAAADYRAQAVAVEYPSWLPFTPSAAPHVTVSVGDDVPAKEAGDLTARALEMGQVTPVVRLKLLQGTVGVQLSDGSRVFSVEELQAALAAAAQRQQAQGAPRPSGPLRILPRGAPPPVAAVAAAPAAAAVAAPEPATEPAVPAAPAPAAAPSTGGISSAGGGGGGISTSSAVQAAAWDLDALLDQLHLADLDQPGAGAGTGRGSSAAPAVPAAPPQHAQQQQQQQQPPPRRGLLKLPASVAAEMTAPASGSSSGGAGGGGGPAGRAAPGPPPGPAPTIRVVSRPGLKPGARTAPQQRQLQQQPWDRPASPPRQWAEPAAPEPAVSVLGKSVEEEAAEAAAGEEPLDLVSSLASLLPADHSVGGWLAMPPPPQQQQQARASAAGAAAGQQQAPPLPSPSMLQGGGAVSSGYETSSSSSGGGGGGGGGGEEEGIGAAAAAAPVDPESHSLLQLQFPELHSLVIDTALRMHGGSLQAAAQFLAVMDQQQQELGLGVGAGGGGQGSGRLPAQPTLGTFLQGLLPEEPAAPAYDFPPAAAAAAVPGMSSSARSSYADSSYDFAGGGVSGAGGKQLAQQRQGPGPAQAALLGRGWQQQGGGGGRGRGRGKAARRSSGGGGGGTAGDDPMSVTERQAMNLHLSAKRLYTQAAQEAFSSGQLGLAKELQATARSHGDAAGAARRRANASAFRSTNAGVVNSFTLDLHGQHVDEALTSLERYLVTLGGLGHPGGVLLQVITGVGRHSHGNQPRVLPAVVRYLSEAGYKFDSQEDNPGVIVVSIGC